MGYCQCMLDYTGSLSDDEPAQGSPDPSLSEESAHDEAAEGSPDPSGGDPFDEGFVCERCENATNRCSQLCTACKRGGSVLFPSRYCTSQL